MPDADLDMAAKVVSDSAFGCAGQRCLAVSAAIVVGEAREKFSAAILDIAGSLRVGNGLDESVQMGPVISPASKTRIERAIATGVEGGGRAMLDGRGAQVANGERGNFLKPTVLTGIGPDHVLATTEIFGPVLALETAADLDEAIAVISGNPYGNAASIFTSSGVAARKFRYEIPTGNVGVNIGVAAPMAYFPFSGWKDSFLGVLHGQGRDGVEFYTDKKVVVERWPKEWSRKF
jgi:malonate-semialdehyde dehydrogenase (acetylating)/methylmalonate-semialdehyde dehydrogenase